MKVVMPRELRREERLGFHRTQPEAYLESRGSQASHSWNTRGNRRIGSLARRRGLWLTNTSCAEYISHPGLADVFSFKMTQAISRLTAKRYTRSGGMKFLLISRNPPDCSRLPQPYQSSRDNCSEGGIWTLGRSSALHIPGTRSRPYVLWIYSFHVAECLPSARNRARCGRHRMKECNRHCKGTPSLIEDADGTYRNCKCTMWQV